MTLKPMEYEHVAVPPAVRTARCSAASVGPCCSSCSHHPTPGMLSALHGVSTVAPAMFDSNM